MLEPREWVIKIDRNSSRSEYRERYINRIRRFLALQSTDDVLRCNHYLRGFLHGLFMGELIHVKENDELKELFPDIAAANHRDVPFGPDVRGGLDAHPDVNNLSDDIVLDAYTITWIGLKNTVHRATLRGEAIPELDTLAWRGFLQASRETGEFTGEQRDEFLAMLPPNDDPFTPLMHRLAVEDGALPA